MYFIYFKQQKIGTLCHRGVFFITTEHLSFNKAKIYKKINLHHHREHYHHHHHHHHHHHQRLNAQSSSIQIS